ncbi:rho GTPase-activating protein 27-like isoform X2 [Rhinoderma darwinii]|uniref:rho GTPase-activating protein 27-like isoform X2 n=1 Tax=Rhinoderma darwinii TaxID=43563 RepID=UPI003F676804
MSALLSPNNQVFPSSDVVTPSSGLFGMASSALPGECPAAPQDHSFPYNSRSPFFSQDRVAIGIDEPVGMQSAGILDKDFVLVEHGFEYTAKDGSIISIKPHERYLLLKRTNEHWWHVCRDHKSKPFYIPAKYVKVLSSISRGSHGTDRSRERSEDLAEHTPCTQYSYTFVPADLHNTSIISLPSPSAQGGVALTDLLEMGPASAASGNVQHLLTTGSSRSLLDLSQLRCNAATEQRRSRDSVNTDHKLGPLRTFHNSKKVSDPLKRISFMWPPDLQPRIRPSQSLNDLQLIKSAPPSSIQPTPDTVKIPGIQLHMEELLSVQHSNVAGSDSCSALEKVVNEEESPSPIYANLEDLYRDEARQRTSSQQRGSTSTIDDWETHTDKESGQLFYYNCVTGETTWDCPFDQAEETLQSPVSPTSLSSLLGEVEWEKHFDESSAQFYFYNSVTGETSWDLPPESELHLLGPPTPEADYPAYSPDNIDVYPEADYHGNYMPPPPQQALADGQYSGWSCQIKDGQKLYINSNNGETWLQSQDQHGKTYFYTPDGSISQWKLPQLGPPEMQSGSSDLNQNSNVFTSWQNNFTAFSLQKETETKGLEKAGVLHKTKIAENGRRLRKNWSSTWTVLEGGILTFFKDTKNLSSNSLKQSLLTVPEHTVRLQGASLSWATKDKSSKKHVMELRTRGGCEFLIHHDSEAITKDWFTSINKSIGKNVHISSDYTSENETESLSEFGSTEKLGIKDEKKNSGQNNSESERNVRAKLRKFLQRRPTLQSLRDKGYIHDQVFGCHLHQLCEREKRDVPEFVSKSIEVVEKRGLDIDGLYRISGNLAVIQKLRYKVDHGECILCIYNPLTQDPKQCTLYPTSCHQTPNNVLCTQPPVTVPQTMYSVPNLLSPDPKQCALYPTSCHQRPNNVLCTQPPVTRPQTIYSVPNPLSPETKQCALYPTSCHQTPNNVLCTQPPVTRDQTMCSVPNLLSPDPKQCTLYPTSCHQTPNNVLCTQPPVTRDQTMCSVPNLLSPDPKQCALYPTSCYQRPNNLLCTQPPATRDQTMHSVPNLLSPETKQCTLYPTSCHRS